MSKFVLMVTCCAYLFLAGCGSDVIQTQDLTLTPNTFDITVDSSTGMATGATAIQATLNGDPFDISMLVWSTQSSTAPVGCIGVDQAGVPHCNTGCGSSFNGTMKAVVGGTSTSTLGVTQTITVNCTVN